MAESSPTKRISVIATVGAAILFLITAAFGIDTGEGSSTTTTTAPSASASALPACDELPPQAEDTATDITAGGPYDYPDNDNRRFGNYEGLLPDAHSDYYREYTVDTPGLDHRGARRIVTGGGTGTGTDPEVWYYTDDHYDTFCEITDEF